jgi:hypothetical protein
MDPLAASQPTTIHPDVTINHIQSETLPPRARIPPEPTSKSGKTGPQKPLIQELNESPDPPTPNPPQSTNQHVKARTQASHAPTSHGPSTVSSPSSPLQPYSQSHPARIGITNPTLSTLEKLVRQTPPENVHVLYETLFNLDAGKLAGIFGQFGFDSSFLNAFLDAILFMQAEPKWVDQSVLLLDSIRRCGRFNIAVTFAPRDKVIRVFEGLEKRADREEGKGVRQVKSFWIE